MGRPGVRLERPAAALARAFRHDPAVSYLLPYERRRERAMRFAYSCYLRYGVRHGVVDIAPHGAAIWLPAHHAHLSVGELLRVGFAAAPLVFGPPAFGRMIRFGNAITALREGVLEAPYWYLFILGAHPTGRGEGGRLLGPGLARADRDRLPCYLETASPRTLPFYRRHGFEVVAESRVPRGPHLWALVRAPRAPTYGG